MRRARVSFNNFRAVECRVSDVRGRVVQSFPIITRGTSVAGQEFTWDASALPAGLYTLRVSDGARQMTRKIFVQK
jgi:hypothetical protein